MNLSFALPRKRLSKAIVLTLLFNLSAAAKSDDATLRILNALRVRECAAGGVAPRAFVLNARLNEAARLVANGAKTRDALQKKDYAAEASATIILRGSLEESGIKRMLSRGYCKTIGDPRLSEVGYSVGDRELSIVFASPFVPPASEDASKVTQQVLKLVNEARAHSRLCGRKRFAAVPPLTLNPLLAKAAQLHAKDMALHRRMSHTGSDGSSPDDRATSVGYIWKAVGENVAMGQQTAKEVVDSWLQSPHHCENIMDPDFKEMAVAYTVASKNEASIYWAQAFGTRR